MKVLKILQPLLFLLVSGCTSIPTKTKDSTTTIHYRIQQNTPSTTTAMITLTPIIAKTLQPPILLSTHSTQPLRRFDLMAQQLPAHDFFTTLTHISHENIIVSPNITNTITLALHQVTLEQVLAALKQNYAYCYQHTDYGYSIQRPTLQTQLFHINYLDVKRHSQSKIAISSGEITTASSSNTRLKKSTSVPENTITTSNDNHFWAQLSETIHGIAGIDPPHHNKKNTPAPSDVSGGRRVVVNTQTGTILVRAYPQQLKQISRYLTTIEKESQREVIINAKIIEVSLNRTFQSGIDWQLLNHSLQQNGASAMALNTLSAFNPIFTLSAHWHQQFSLLIKLLMTQGRVNVLSSPRIATINNQTAVIKVGNDQFYITGVNSITDNASGSQSQSQNIDFTPFFSGVALNVTPHIDNDQALTLHIHPLVSTVTEKNKNFTVSGQAESIPLATSTIRESDSIVHAEDGQIIIIGGLTASEIDRDKTTVPWLSRLPLLGALFQSRHNTTDKKAIVILLQPTIIHHHR